MGSIVWDLFFFTLKKYSSASIENSVCFVALYLLLWWLVRAYFLTLNYSWISEQSLDKPWSIITHWAAKFSVIFILFFYTDIRQLQWIFPGSSAGKESACNAGDPASIPG